MGTVPCAGSRADEAAHGLPRSDRSEKHLCRRRYGKAWIPVCGYRTVNNDKRSTIVGSRGVAIMTAKIIPVILCGGGGTRLWPVSRESMPKQFVPLIGQGSTFQQVITRISNPELFARPIIITNAEFRFVVAEQLRDCGISADIV